MQDATKKPISTFLDFRLRGEEPIEEPEPKGRAFKTVAHICCPVCGMHTVLRRTGRYCRSGKKRSKEGVFDIDLENAPFVSIRIASGRGGFIERATIKLEDISKLPKEDKEVILPVIKQLKTQCSKVIKTVEKFI